MSRHERVRQKSKLQPTEIGPSTKGSDTTGDFPTSRCEFRAFYSGGRPQDDIGRIQPVDLEMGGCGPRRRCSRATVVSHRASRRRTCPSGGIAAAGCRGRPQQRTFRILALHRVRASDPPVRHADGRTAAVDAGYVAPGTPNQFGGATVKDGVITFSQLPEASPSPSGARRVEALGMSGGRRLRECQ
jgi:hypothetical protein